MLISAGCCISNTQMRTTPLNSWFSSDNVGITRSSTSQNHITLRITEHSHLRAYHIAEQSTYAPGIVGSDLPGTLSAVICQWCCQQWSASGVVEDAWLRTGWLCWYWQQPCRRCCPWWCSPQWSAIRWTRRDHWEDGPLAGDARGVKLLDLPSPLNLDAAMLRLRSSVAACVLTSVGGEDNALLVQQGQDALCLVRSSTAQGECAMGASLTGIINGAISLVLRFIYVLL